MALLQQLIGFTLRQVIGDVEIDVGEVVGGVSGRVMTVVSNHFRDHSQTLPRALTRANDKAWHALGVALGGNGLFDWLKRKFVSGDDNGLRQQVAEFLKSNAASFPGTSEQSRSACLKEYQQAGQARLFHLDAVQPKAIAQQAATFNRYTNPAALIQGTNAAMERVAQQLTEHYPNLARLVSLPTADGIPLVAAAFTYFFRREVETDDELANGLFFEYLRRLTINQAKAFAEIAKALDTLGADLQAIMEQLSDIALGLKDIKDDTTEIKELLKNFKLGVSYENEGERAYLRQQREKFRKLPRGQQTAADWSAMADRLGEAGLFDLAQLEHENAAQAARQENNPALAATEHYKAFRAACEKQQWAGALTALRQAVALDVNYAPFDLQQYELKEILGAGGFGTVIKCYDRFLDREVAIKIIYTAELARNNIQEVFKEAAILTSLRHAAIIGVVSAGFADSLAKKRPFIIMEYFPSRSLAVRLKHLGILPVADFLSVARQVAEALRAAHNVQPQPVYHRDLKPDNVLVRKLGEQWQVKVIDFGLAVRSQAIHKSISRPAELRSRMEQSYAGTVDYAPPEQKGKLAVPVGPYSDIFAFGKMCCEALFGITDPKRRHWEREKDRIPPVLANLLERCIEHEVADRPQHFQEVLNVLDTVAAELDPVKQPQHEQEEQERQRKEEQNRQRAVEEQQRLAALAAEQQRQCEQAAAEQRQREEAGRQRAKERQVGEILTNSLGMKFAWIPPGTFVMGSPESEAQRDGDEKQFGVRLTKGFYLGIYQVTQAQWHAIMGNNPSDFTGDDRPVESVSWDDCQEFLKKLSQKDGKRYRLPMEAEWEYACRAGTTTPFHFKTISTDLANYDGNYTYGDSKKGNYREETTTVGSFPANPWGLFDMHGNVWEWCADWYGPYPETDLKDINKYIKDHQGVNSGDARVVRGGSWLHYPWYCRAAFRSGRVPDRRRSSFGCRVCFPLE